MAGVEAVETVHPTSPPPSHLHQPSYLKTYPYLFVRETDQTDYFCTVCEQSLKEDQLQSHLFDTHSAENLQDYFVRVSPGLGAGGQKKWLYICVVCWAKMGQVQEMHGHRETCKVNFGEEGAMDQVDNDMEPTSVVSTPDIPTLVEDHEESHMNGIHKCSNGRDSSPPPFPHPEVILDTESPHLIQLPKYPETAEVCGKGFPTNNNLGMKQEPVYSSQCMQCSLCTMILPSTSYLSHLRAYHRVSCSLNNANCPLCMSLVPIMDLTVHLASQHGLVPQSAVNALLLWVLTSNTFALNDSAQASLKAKFKGQAVQFPPLSTNTVSPTKPKNAISSMPSVNQTPVASKPRPVPTTMAAPIPTTVNAHVGKPMATQQPKINGDETEANIVNDLRGKVGMDQIVAKFTRSHMGPGGKQSHQCLVCSKWYAVPPVKHLRSHMMTFTKERRKILQLASGAHICLICYRVFDSQAAVTSHIITHSPEGSPPGLPGGGQVNMPASILGQRGLLAEALLGFQPYSASTPNNKNEKPVNGNNGARAQESKEVDDLPLGATFETPGLKPNSPSPSLSSSMNEVNVELDNAGRVKSGKVRKQCELCGEWSNIKWFFKHMSEVHQALFCRCCREYLPIHEHKEHRTWHSMPPYMGQKIRIEEGQPIIIDRKERASLTPIGSLAAWGGSSGGLVVKAVDEINRKRKAAADNVGSTNGPNKNAGTQGESGYQPGMLPPDLPGRDSLMPKERCPVCAIEITHKNLARHIKLRHGIKYKFCYKCRKLVPGQLYLEHKALHESGQLETVPLQPGEKVGDAGSENSKTDDEEDETIEIPEEMLDEALNANNLNRKDDSFRANTSLTKLESLMGKEFKHPRRKCQICGYSVSYSNFKRHLRNAHPGEVTDGSDLMMREDGIELMGHHMDDGDRLNDNNFEEEEPKNEIVEGYTECKRCGDYVMKEFLARHMRMTHGEEVSQDEKSSSPKPRNIIMRPCPVCGVEMRSDSITKHCKTRHKVSYRYCSACSKYVLKKYFKSHLRKHDAGELPGDVKRDGETEDDLDTSRDGEDEDERDDNDEGSNDATSNEPMETDNATPLSKLPSKIYNCVDCTRMFMSAEAHANHLREMHGGEGGSVILKLPGDRTEEKDDNDDTMGDELVIDDSQ